MSDRRPVLRVTYKRGDTNYSVISVWPGKFPGSYSISRDKGTDKYPAISIVEVIKEFAAGNGFVNVSVESEREQRGGSKSKHTGGDYGGSDPMGDDSIPFAPKDDRLI